MIHTATDVRSFLDYLERICRRSPHTVRSYATSLEQYRRFLRARHRCARSATFEDLLDFAATLHAKSPSTARTRLAAVKALHRYLHARGLVDRDLAALVPVPARRRGERPAHAAGAVARVYAELETDRDRALFGLMYGSLLRISEARCVLVDDVDLERRSATVIGKGDKLRTVELDRRTVLAIGRYLAHERRRARSRYLFPSYKPGHDAPMSETPIRRMLEHAVERAGERGRWTPHALRRSMGRHLRQAGADPFLVRDAFGHEYLSDTAGYVAGTDDVVRLPDALRDAIAELAASDELEHERDRSA